MKFTSLFIILLLASTFSAADAEEIPLSFTYPSFTGDFYASGNIFFPPGVVESEENIMVKVPKLGEAPAKITVLRRWPDGSVLNAEVIFVANTSRKQNYVVCYGQDIQRKKIIAETAVLPTVSFSVAGAPRISEKVNIDVGQINVRVDKSHDIYYYWHIIPIVILITLSYYRYRRIRKNG